VLVVVEQMAIRDLPLLHDDCIQQERVAFASRARARTAAQKNKLRKFSYHTYRIFEIPRLSRTRISEDLFAPLDMCANRPFNTAHFSGNNFCV
jgi:hypothetical protein